GGRAERIDASRWRIELAGVGRDELSRAVDQLMARDHVPVERLGKDGRRIVDARAALFSLHVEEYTASCGILSAVVRQVTPAVRPDDVLSALFVVAALELPVPARAVRVAPGPLHHHRAPL